MSFEKATTILCCHCEIHVNNARQGNLLRGVGKDAEHQRHLQFAFLVAVQLMSREPAHRKERKKSDPEQCDNIN
jgi:hypothetical protein